MKPYALLMLVAGLVLAAPPAARADSPTCRRDPSTKLSEREWVLTGTWEHPVTFHVSQEAGERSLTISGTLCDDTTGDILPGASGEIVRFEGELPPQQQTPTLSDFETGVVSKVDPLPFTTSATGQFKISGLKPGTYVFLLQSAGPRGGASQVFTYDIAWSHGFSVARAYGRS